MKKWIGRREQGTILAVLGSDKRMNIKQTIARNVVWNWAGTATHMLAGFIIAPFLVRQLGESGYGLWVLIASVTGYFDLFDLGLRGSLGRNLAFYRAKGDVAGVRAIFNTGLALLLTGSLLVLLATAIAVTVFFWIFPVPPEQIGEVRLALALIGLNLALVFPLSAFDGTLWAYQRFDLINGIDIPIITLRASLTFLLVERGPGNLIIMALIVLLTTLLMGLAKAVAVFRLDPALRLHLASVVRTAVRQLFDFGFWMFLLSIAKQTRDQIGPLLIGSQLRVALVTPFSIASRLVNYVYNILDAATGVLTPLMTALHAEEKHAQQRWLFVQGGKASLVLALFFVGFFLLLGETFLVLWMGQRLEHAAVLLTILILGELLPLSQKATYSLVVGMSRHRLWAIMSLVEVGLAVVLAVALMPGWGIVGVCLALVIPGTICRGLVQMIYACRLVQMPLWEYLLQAMFPAAVAASGPIVGLFLLTSWHQPRSWLDFGGCVLLYLLGYVLSVGLLLVGPAELKKIGSAFRPRSAAAAAPAAPAGAEPLVETDTEPALSIDPSL